MFQLMSTQSIKNILFVLRKLRIILSHLKNISVKKYYMIFKVLNLEIE